MNIKLGFQSESYGKRVVIVIKLPLASLHMSQLRLGASLAFSYTCHRICWCGMFRDRAAHV
jgi:hypothetical protein